MTCFKTIASNYDHFANNNSHYISQNKEMIKKGVPQTAEISKLERISSKSQSQLVFAGDQLL